MAVSIEASFEDSLSSRAKKSSTSTNQVAAWMHMSEHVCLNTRQNSAHAYIIEIVCACVEVYFRRAIWSVRATWRLLCCWSDWLLLSCEWTLELLLNDESNKPGVFNNEEKFWKQNVSATRVHTLPIASQLEAIQCAYRVQFNLCRQEFAKQVS